jgi:DNA-directed RNA polymerase specialized sigma24 family protein
LIRLSPREREVVLLLGGKGLTYREVGNQLGISSRTVETYAKRVLQRYPNSKKPQAAIAEIYYTVVSKVTDSEISD